MDEKTTDPTPYCLENKRDIDRIRAEVTQLMKEDMGLNHRLDNISQRLESIDKAFSYSRETGHKTWEAVQKISVGVERMNGRLDMQDKAISDQEKQLEKVAEAQQWTFRGIAAVIFVALIVGIIRAAGVLG